MKILISVLIVFFVAGRVLSQELVFSEPIKLGSNVNSEAEELSPMLSTDGKTLYFSRAFYERNTGGKFAGTDIWISKKGEDGQWLPAVNMSNSWNNKLSNSVIGINQEHSVVYLLNAYSNKSGISFSKFYSGTWNSPEFIPISGINRDDFVGFYANPKFDVILISMKGKDSFGEEDLYVSLKDSFGNWTEPKNLGATINTKGFEISPFLTEDKKRLFFSSNGHGGLGDADILYCDRLFDSWETWSVPKNLGDKINSKSFDAYFSMYDSVGFFSSNRNGASSEIYSANISVSKASQNFGKRQLNRKEVDELLGNRVVTEVKFDKNSIILTSTQNELLFFIVSKILLRPDITLQLIINDSAKNGVSETRVKSVFEKIESLGINATRMDMKISESGSDELEIGTVRILFYR